MSKLDQAQKIEQMLRDQAIANHQNRVNKPGAEFEHCQECGVEIPKARRDAITNCSTCVDCQQLLEQEQKHYRS